MFLIEAMAIILLFHLSGYRCFKWYYQMYVCAQMRNYFSTPVSDNWFIKLMQRCLCSKKPYN
jgi:hypothetical protein